MTEKELLSHIHSISQKTGFLQTGDDAAVVGELVISTDQFIEGTHFTWQQMTPQQVGYKAVVQALSDLAAMASPPRAIFCSAAWPKLQTEKILLLLQGVEQACLEYKVPLSGGDITSSQALTYLDITVVGDHQRSQLKKGMRAGDLIAVSGPLGSAKAGLYSLDQSLDFKSLIHAFQKPRAHISIAVNLNQTGHITALTDISDSLSKSLHDFLEHSKIGIEIEFEKIPIQNELRAFCELTQQKLDEYVLFGGEDYQLLIAMPENTPQKVISDHGLTVIGRAVPGLDLTVIKNKKRQKILLAGWDPFIL